jgi:hypothetical protein
MWFDLAAIMHESECEIAATAYVKLVLPYQTSKNGPLTERRFRQSMLVPKVSIGEIFFKIYCAIGHCFYALDLVRPWFNRSIFEP